MDLEREEKKKHYEKTKRVCRNTEIVQNLKDGKKGRLLCCIKVIITKWRRRMKCVKSSCEILVDIEGDSVVNI